MKIHYLNGEGKETLLDNIAYLQNVDDNTFIALTENDKELTLRKSRIEGVIDDSFLVENREQVLIDFFNHKRVDTKIIEKLFGISFSTGLKLFDFSRTAAWCSIVGETAEERACNGQRIVTQFRLKEKEVIENE